MDLTEEEITFLEILADGKRKTYVHIVKGFGMPLTPMAPTFTNRIAKPLKKRRLIKRRGFCGMVLRSPMSVARFVKKITRI